MKNEAIAAEASPARRFDRRGARAFYRVLVEYGEVRADPDALLEDHEVARLLDRIPATTPLELRDRAMFELACGRGLGAAELVRLDLASFELDPAEPARRAGGRIGRGRALHLQDRPPALDVRRPAPPAGVGASSGALRAAFHIHNPALHSGRVSAPTGRVRTQPSKGLGGD